MGTTTRPGRVWPVIEKHPDAAGVRPNVPDPDAARRTFTWDAARRLLPGLPGGRGLNIGYECSTAQVAAGRGERVALRFVDKAGGRRELTYRELDTASNRFAAALDALDVRRGERVFLLLDRVPELYVAVLGTLKHGSVVCPLFPAFGPEPVRQRMVIGDAAVLVTTAGLFRKRVEPIRADVPALRHILLTDQRGEDGPSPATVSLPDLLARMPDAYDVPATDREDAALVHFTSGTTGTPKGAVHVHDAIVSHHATAATALDLHGDDVFWCTADPGWVTGMSYGVIAPLSHGVTSVVDEGDFDAQRWYQILQDEHVSVWYTAPTAVRMLMRAGAEVARGYDLSALRFVASVGEPLNPEAVVWGNEAIGLPIHDNWWQTETGGIMIANLAAMDIRPGSMGKPLPGVEAGVLARDEHGAVAVREGAAVMVTEPDVEGHLALRPGWPSMFRGYLHEQERYDRCFVGGWYVTGDLVRRDADGYFWFVGRADDVIKSSGHLIGPFEVESVLMEHEAVIEAGVIGKPDPVAGEIVKAFVSLRAGYEPTDQLRLQLIGFARKRLGAAVAPREITFDQHLPKTKSGKIMRRLLKARELGLPEGDLSTLEPAP